MNHHAWICAIPNGYGAMKDFVDGMASCMIICTCIVVMILGSLDYWDRRKDRKQ